MHSLTILRHSLYFYMKTADRINQLGSVCMFDNSNGDWQYLATSCTAFRKGQCSQCDNQVLYDITIRGILLPAEGISLRFWSSLFGNQKQILVSYVVKVVNRLEMEDLQPRNVISLTDTQKVATTSINYSKKVKMLKKELKIRQQSLALINLQHWALQGC